MQLDFQDSKHSKFEVFSWDESVLLTVQYFCKNSFKLEAIHLHGQFKRLSEEALHAVYDSVLKSIGPLIERSALRILDINIDDYDKQMFNESIRNLFDYSNEKPKLETLTLCANIPLGSVYQFVNNNFNLKSLKLGGKMELNENTAQDLIKILQCGNGLEQIQFKNLELGSKTYQLVYALSKERRENLLRKLLLWPGFNEFPKGLGLKFKLRYIYDRSLFPTLIEFFQLQNVSLNKNQ